MAAHGAQESRTDGPDTTLRSSSDHNPTPAPSWPANSSSISSSISTSILSHHSDPTISATSPAQPAQLAASTTTPTWAAWGGSDESAATNEHPAAITSADPAAPNPQNRNATLPTNPTAAPKPTVPARGNGSPRDARHEASGDTTAAESSWAILIPQGSTSTANADATLAGPEETHEFTSIARAATVPEDRYHQAHPEQSPAILGESVSTSHSNPQAQPTSYDSDANTLAGSTIEIDSVCIIIPRPPHVSAVTNT